MHIVRPARHLAGLGTVWAWKRAEIRSGKAIMGHQVHMLSVLLPQDPLKLMPFP